MESRLCGEKLWLLAFDNSGDGSSRCEPIEVRRQSRQPCACLLVVQG